MKKLTNTKDIVKYLNQHSIIYWNPDENDVCCDFCVHYYRMVTDYRNKEDDVCFTVVLPSECHCGPPTIGKNSMGEFPLTSNVNFCGHFKRNLARKGGIMLQEHFLLYYKGLTDGKSY